MKGSVWIFSLFCMLLSILVSSQAHSNNPGIPQTNHSNPIAPNPKDQSLNRAPTNIPKNRLNLPNSKSLPNVRPVGLGTSKHPPSYSKSPPGQSGTREPKTTASSNPKAQNQPNSIPTFSEWAHVEDKKPSPFNKPNRKIKSTIHNHFRRNYASVKCYAEIMDSHPESQNPDGLLTSNLDDYMLNRCQDKKWFIVRLCEIVRVELILLGNLQLYSSNPKEIELGFSTQYPARQWEVVGTFIVPNQRILHPFLFPTTNLSWVKFIRVIIKSHYGREHFCPLSRIKVFGMTEIDVLHYETSDEEEEEVDSSEANLGDPSFHLKPKSPKFDGTKNAMIWTAIQVFIDFVKRAVEMWIYNKGTTPIGYGGDPQRFLSGNVSGNCITLNQCLPDTIEQRDKVIENLSCHRQLLGLLQVRLAWMEWRLDCHKLLEYGSLGSASMLQGFLVAVYGESIIRSLCHFARPLLTCFGNGVMGSNMIDSAKGKERKGSDLTGPSAPPKAPINVIQESQQSIPTSKKRLPLLLRLNNRLKALEQNASLNSGYLQVFSLTFNKIIEETHFQRELFRMNLTHGFNGFRQTKEEMWKKLETLSRELDQVATESISELQLQQNGLVLFTVVQFCWIMYLRFGFKRGDKQLMQEKVTYPSYFSRKRRRDTPGDFGKAKRQRRMKKRELREYTATAPIKIDSKKQQSQPIFRVVTNSTVRFYDVMR